MSKEKVVIIGAGFGGLAAAKNLRDEDYEIVIIDRTNHHLFQPLLYQVATAALSPADIAIPIRGIFNKDKNVFVIMNEVTGIDKANKKVFTKDSEIEFDYLIVAPGTKHSYFGHPEWERSAKGLKTLSDALTIREKIIHSLEMAEKTDDEKERNKFLTFVIVGGGPTGVELAGAIAEIAKKTMIRDYKRVQPDDTKVYLVEAMGNILNAYPDELQKKAKEQLESLGVKILLNKKVTDVSHNKILFEDDELNAANIIWAAGNEASPLLKTLEVQLDKAGRVIVNDDCTIPGSKDIFVIGDAAHFKDDNENLLPGVAQVAIQQGGFVAEVIKSRVIDGYKKKFIYNDKGNLATIGKARAVADIKGFKLSGLFAWIVWSLVHILYLIGFRNRFRVMAEWIWYYISNRNGIRLIVGKENSE